MNEPQELSAEKCLELISGGVVGRVALCTPSGPHIVPVNYALIDDAIVFRTTPYSVLGTLGWSSRLAFEVDHLDYERQRGWSVVAVGPGQMIEDAEAVALIKSFWDPRPWAGGNRLLYLRLRWTSLTGRRIGTVWTPSEETPVRRTL